MLLHHVDGVQQLSESLQRKVFALDRNEDGIRRGEGIQGQQPEGRRTIDEDEIIPQPVHFGEFYSHHVLQTNEGTISLFRRDGTLLARHPDSTPNIGRSYGAQPLFSRALTADEIKVIMGPLVSPALAAFQSERGVMR